MNYLRLNIINLSLQNDINNHYFLLENKELKFSNKYIKLINSLGEKKLMNNKIKNTSVIDLMNRNITINDIISKHKNVLSSIIITFLCLQKFIIMNKIDLTIDENYKDVYLALFEKNCFLDVSSSFHIMNLIQMKDNDVCSAKLNFNFLDSITTNKLLEFIYKNQLIYLLELSLFSSEDSYTHQNITNYIPKPKKKKMTKIKLINLIILKSLKCII